MDRSLSVLAVGVLLLLALSWVAARGGDLDSLSLPGAAEAAPPSQRKGPAQRIVSATLPTDELLLELVEPARLAALSTFADDPELSHAAPAAAAVAGRVRGEAETILARDPDLVFLFAFTRPEAVSLLRASGVKVELLPVCESLADIRAMILEVGAAVQAGDRAQAILQRMDTALAELSARTREAERPRVLFYGAGGASWGAGCLFDELLQVAGGRNVVAERGLSGYVSLPLEEALALDPEVILLSAYGDGSRVRRLGLGASPLTDPAWRDVQAVRTGRVYVLNGAHMESINHHVAEAAREMARALHPRLFGTERGG